MDAGIRVQVRKIEIVGNKAISTAELAAIAAPYEGRVVSSEELQELRNRLSLAYVNKGYLNSGALLPDQEVRDGVVRYEIVEGVLAGVELSGNEHLSTDYISDRIGLGAGPPLNVAAMQERLQILQQDGLIERINAELLPGTRPGEAVLRARVQEAVPYQAGIGLSNRRPPSVGSRFTELFASHRSLTGHGDTLDARIGLTKGADDYQLGYSLPVTPQDTIVSLRTSKSTSQVIETPFDQVDIRSKTRTSLIGVTHPFHKTVSESLVLGLRFEDRVSESSLLGVPFSFTPGIPNGRTEVGVWRFTQDWLRRSADDVMAIRSMFSQGKTNAGAQVNGVGPAGRFLSWLGQAQWVGRIHKDHQFVLRADVQYAWDPLVSIEKFAMGGAATVRGFRENQIVRDSAVIGSAEYRILVWSGESGQGRLQAAAFVDYGRAWNGDLTPATPKNISSYGIGMLGDLGGQLQGQIYLAKPSRKFQQTTHDLQDSGVHFSLAYQFF
jgi:hemolysin activation/secretion protein